MKYSSLIQGQWYQYLTKYELPVETSLGLPFLSWEKGRLQMTFYPHSVRIQDKQIAVYPAECRICLQEPFEYMESFVRYHRSKSEPVCRIGIEWLAGEGKAEVQELYELWNSILENQVRSGEESVFITGLYQEKQNELIRKLNLWDVYQEIEE